MNSRCGRKEPEGFGGPMGAATERPRDPGMSGYKENYARDTTLNSEDISAFYLGH